VTNDRARERRKCWSGGIEVPPLPGFFGAEQGVKEYEEFARASNDRRRSMVSPLRQTAVKVPHARIEGERRHVDYAPDLGASAPYAARSSRACACCG
jgi:hypothetical protein